MSHPASSSSAGQSSSTASAASATAGGVANAMSTTSGSIFSSSSATGSLGASIGITSSLSASLSSSTTAAAKPSLLSSTRSLSGSGSTSAMGNSGSGSSENLPPRTLARVARDVRDLVKSPPEGVRLVLDGETGMPGSLSEILAEIEGPEQTPYHTRYFQLKLVLSTDFPATPPRGYFLTKIYHPNVDPTTGAICVNTLKKDWTSTTSLSHVLTVIRCLLIVPFPESSLNDEAGKNFMDSYDEYARRAKLLAGVHGLTSWSSDAGAFGGKSEGQEDADNGKKKAVDNGLPNGSSNGGNVKLGKNGSRSNIVRAGSKSLDKKNKKKSLRRL
ncbi:hypothetical protein ACHAXR_008587 [Thalassiosira sp. AJA248-18]